MDAWYAITEMRYLTIETKLNSSNEVKLNVSNDRHEIKCKIEPIAGQAAYVPTYEVMSKRTSRLLKQHKKGLRVAEVKMHNGRS